MNNQDKDWGLMAANLDEFCNDNFIEIPGVDGHLMVEVRLLGDAMYIHYSDGFAYEIRTIKGVPQYTGRKFESEKLEHTNRGWVSIDDIPPPAGVDVLVINDQHTEQVHVAERLEGSENQYRDYYNAPVFPTHWQYLPDPPEYWGDDD